MKPGVIVSHSGRQHSYRVAAALQEAGLLDAFFTSGYYTPERIPDRWARQIRGLDSRLRKRWQEGLDPARIRRHPWREVPELLARVLRASPASQRRLVERRDMGFDHMVAREMRGLPSSVFWGFQGSCFESLESARRGGKTGVVEMASIPGQVIRRLLERERPASAGYGSESGDDYRARTDAEPLRADWCVAASTFCASALEAIGVEKNRIRVIPLGADVRKFAYSERPINGPLRVLFVGKLGVHKGLGYLLNAMKRLDTSAARLTLAGPSVGDFAGLGREGAGVEVLGPVADVAELYASHDVLVLPSLYEGFGLVVVEAMASGMPVVATRNSCAPDVVRDGEDGFVIPPFDADAIAARLELLAQDRRRAAQMGRSASQRAQEFSWGMHSRRVGEFARELVGEARSA